MQQQLGTKFATKAGNFPYM